jgi:hypothetical protein
MMLSTTMILDSHSVVVLLGQAVNMDKDQEEVAAKTTS